MKAQIPQSTNIFNISFSSQVTLVLLIVAIGMLAGCEPVHLQTPTTTPTIISNEKITIDITDQPTQLITQSPTLTFCTPSTTPTAQTPTATPDPFNTLSFQGPYLLYQKHFGVEPEQTLFVMLDIDAQDRKMFDLPGNGYVRNLASAVSPDGKWIAYHTGSYEKERKDLALNLLYIPDGSSQSITYLLSDNYPENFQELGVLLTKHDPDQFSNEWDWSGPVTWSFSPGIYAIDWSPDGRYLAFAGQMDGPSSNLYIFDIDAKTIKRVTNDLYNVGHIDWSPNGEWIGILNAIPGINYQGTQFQVVSFTKDLNEKPIIYDSGVWVTGFGWIKPHIYFLLDLPDGCCGPRNLRYIDVRNGDQKNIWKQSSAAYAFDPEKNLFMVSAADGVDDPGFYLVDMDGNSLKISDDIFWDYSFLGEEMVRFFGFDSAKVIGINENGDLVQISHKPFADASISPNRRWYLLYQPFKYSYNELVGMDLYSVADGYIRTITDKQAEPIWRPDSAGFFYLADGLYYVSMPDGDPELIDECRPEGCNYWLNTDDFIWLP